MMSLITAEGVEEGAPRSRRARLRVNRGGSPVDYAMVVNANMLLSWRTGDVTTTETDAESILAAIRLEPPGPEVVSLRATATNFACYTAMERRDLPAAQALLAEFDASSGGIRVVPTIWLHEIRARVSLADDDPHAALRHLDTLRRELDDAGVDPASLAWRLPAAIAYSRHRRGREGPRHALTEHVELARRWGVTHRSRRRPAAWPPGSSRTPRCGPRSWRRPSRCSSSPTTGSSTPRR